MDLDELSAALQASVVDGGGMVIEAMVDFDPARTLRVAVSMSVFRDLVAHRNPRLLYLEVLPFSFRVELLEGLGIDDDDAFLRRAAVRKMDAAWSRRDGEPSRFIASCVCEGVFHTCVEEASWLDDFRGALEGLRSEHLRFEEDRMEGLVSAANEERRRRAEALQSDPRFAAAKVGPAKRLVLAREMFPDVDDGELRAIVRIAGEEHWLAGTKR